MFCKGVFVKAFFSHNKAGIPAQVRIVLNNDCLNVAVKADNKMMTLIPEDATPIAYGMNVMGADRIWSNGADTKYPELCMAIINYLTTPEGYMTYRYGPKELNRYYDDNGYTCFTELG